ncbi:MAG: hypothetical protein QM605_11105 [Sphingobium sp.]
MIERSPIPRPTFFADPANDRMVAVITALGAEVATLMGRLHTIETLAERNGWFSRADIETYEPDEEERLRRLGLQQAFVERVFQILREDSGQV